MNDSRDGGVHVQNNGAPRSESTQYFFRTSSEMNQNSRWVESQTEASQVKQQSQNYIPVKSINGISIDLDSKLQPQHDLNPVMSADRNSNPYFPSQSKAGMMMNRHMAIDAKLLAQSQFVAAGAAVPLGLT